MGYRSEVAIAIGKEKVEEFKSLLNEAGTTLLGHGNEVEFDDHVVFMWDWVKWYDSYEDVSSIEDAFKAIDEDYKELLRIGESWEDLDDRRDRPNANSYWLSYTTPVIKLMGTSKRKEKE